ncbi:RAMP superfamily CRISPR-associated protein [Corynebacterium glucuronolyticum]|uniref:RAMP superfamily CRISPR-associated protein n=1 Tax=Corynebacterium glucuronolyticum TaxID=39791 RepID=UPI00223ADBC8|nr:RAMP superfamily CRISPR-associated protein [Corynebacterium glucuronolyticum]MCT1563143.1 RAMP superfamily CRISPR-associated protein [Corynebacterium glucuronolyticum]
MFKQMELTGTLAVQSPLHIGSASEGELVDATLMRDGLQRIVIPGTSLTGALRTQFDSPLWGHIAGGDEETSAASMITVFDAFTEQTPEIEVRTMNSIDRRTGGVAGHHLYTREYVLPGVTFRFRCLAEYTEDNAAEMEELIQRIRHRLETHGIQVGKDKSKGAGSLQLENAGLVRRSFDPQHLLRSLRGGEPVGDDTIADESGNVVSITIPFEREGALFLGEKRDGAAVQIVPLTRMLPDGVHFLLPASSIKGVFRNRAEFIARTVTGTPVPDNFLDQVSQSGLVQVADLFGNASVTTPDGSTHPAVRGALTFHDVVSVNSVDPVLYADIVDRTKDNRDGDPAETERADAHGINTCVEKINAQWKRNETTKNDFLHVAWRNSVDRFSGNTVAGALFCTLEPHVTWKPMRLTLDMDRLTTLAHGDEDRVKAACALLLFLLRDLVEGYLRFGVQTTRGSGGILVDPETLKLSSLFSALAADAEKPEEPVSFRDLLFGGDYENARIEAATGWESALATQEKVSK